MYIDGYAAECKLSNLILLCIDI